MEQQIRAVLFDMDGLMFDTERLGDEVWRAVAGKYGVTMTPEGEVLFAHVEIAQEQLQAGESELAGITALESGALTISASETALNVFLLDKLREFHRRYPGVRLRIANHSTPQAIRLAGGGQIAHGGGQVGGT